MLPTRVLEISGSSDQIEGVRLVETQGSKQGIYACLSYCWGDLKTQAGQTTRRNLSSRLEGIPIDDLPSTVADAIRLCFKIGYRYLWVDRLCIVQDDREDWLREASRMCEVYSCSSLTIAVPLCKESSQSFLAERKKGFREQGRFATHSEPNSNRSMRWFSTEHPLKQGQGPWFLETRWGSNNMSRTGNEENNWLRRSWTFQEWMLSPRVLHVDSMTLWDCFDGYANELNYRNMVSPRLPRQPSRFEEDISWESIMQEYSSREITHEADRLPALAGLAERYAQTTGKTYLAGLWLEDLPRSLLWEQESEALAPQAWSPSLPTPSWSWCSLNRPVWYQTFCRGDRDRPFTPFASIVSTSCQDQPPGSFAKVENAWIELSCSVNAVTKRHCDAVSHNYGFFYHHKVNAGGKEWHTAPEYDFHHGDSDRDNVEDIYLLLLGEADSTFGALIAKRFKWDDGRFCFRRVGVAVFHTFGDTSEEAFDLGSQWEGQVVRIV